MSGGDGVGEPICRARLRFKSDFQVHKRVDCSGSVTAVRGGACVAFVLQCNTLEIIALRNRGLEHTSLPEDRLWHCHRAEFCILHLI